MDIPKTELSSALADALRAQAPIVQIQALIDEGEDPTHIEVIQALEDLQTAGARDHAWLNQVWTLPAIVNARRRRADADQAAFDLQSALEDDDLDGVRDALEIMADVGDGADLSIDEYTFLCVAIQNKCSLAIIELLVGLGGGDPHDGCEDAMEALEAMPSDAWKSSVTALPAFE
jgi:hypothetical protein